METQDQIHYGISKYVTLLTSVSLGAAMVMGVVAVHSAPLYMMNYGSYVSGNPSTVLQYPRFWSSILTTYTLVTLGVQAVMEPTNLTPFFSRFSLMFRLQVSGFIMIIELLVILLLPAGKGAVSEMSAAVVIMLMAVVGGVGRGYFENTVYSLLANFHSRHVTAAITGSSFCGTLNSVVRIILKSIGSDSFEAERIKSYIYFGIAIALIVNAMVMLLTMYINPYAKMHVSELRAEGGFWRNIYSRRRFTVRKREMIRDGTLSTDERPGLGEPYGKEGKKINSHTDSSDDGERPLTTAELLQGVPIIPVVKKIFPMMAACFITFFAVFTAYPTPFLMGGKQDNTWFKVLAVGAVHLGDFIGRGLTIFRATWVSRRWVVILSLVRLALSVLMLLFSYGIIPSDVSGYILGGVSGILTGYVAGLSMGYGPMTKTLKGEGERAMAGQAMGVSLLLGASAGSFLQLAFTLPR